MSSSGYVISVDPNDLSRFASFDPREDDNDFLSDDSEELDESAQQIEDMRVLLENQKYRSRLQQLLERIPEREADIIELYFLMGKRQGDIAVIFGMTQPAVSYRLARGIKRIKFLLEISDVTREQMKIDLAEVFPIQEKGSKEWGSKVVEGVHIDVMILINMWETTCQTMVARQLNLTQGRVRHRFFKAVDRLKEAARRCPKYEPYSRIFTKISSKGFNLLHEVVLPQWKGRGVDECI